jgi:hypothetical protein
LFPARNVFGVEFLNIRQEKAIDRVAVSEIMRQKVLDSAYFFDQLPFLLHLVSYIGGVPCIRFLIVFTADVCSEETLLNISCVQQTLFPQLCWIAAFGAEGCFAIRPLRYVSYMLRLQVRGIGPNFGPPEHKASDETSKQSMEPKMT